MILSRGRGNRGPERRALWFREIAWLELALAVEQPRGKGLVLACGTGLWTRHLVQTAEWITPVDASLKAIALNQERLGSGPVDCVVPDLFFWSPLTIWDFYHHERPHQALDYRTPARVFFQREQAQPSSYLVTGPTQNKYSN